MAEGGYEAISGQVFRRATRFHTFFLEYDDPRSGGSEPLADVPEDRFVVLGLISTKRPELEREEELLARIDEAARHFPRDRLAISPQCGFASTLGGNPVSAEAQEAKLGLVGRVAARAWPG
jgi:5-methyltetrahydropteroyltriglutamate--homocysteine methyltransferase